MSVTVRDGKIISTEESELDPGDIRSELRRLRRRRRKLRQKLARHRTYDAELAAEETRLEALLAEAGVAPGLAGDPNPGPL